MPFPESERVVYEKNPLTEVICQLKFPPVLRIDLEPPAAFQEKVRGAFPLYEEAVRQEVPLPNLPKSIALRLGEELGLRRSGMGYEFHSADGRSRVSLTRDFLGLSATEYERWEQFREHLTLPLQTLLHLYAPPFFTRIGLRYQNVIQRSVLGLQDVGWSELLQPYVVGELGAPDISDSVETRVCQTAIRLADVGGHVRMHHGLVETADTRETCYIIDNDFFTEEKTEPDHVNDLLDALHKKARLLFRWCITQRLHEAMAPRSS